MRSRADERYRSIPGILLENGPRFAAREAVVDGEERLTYPELAAQAVRATRAVMAAGIQPGDRVAIWAPNSVEFIVAALGILGAGAWLVPINTRFKGDEAAFVLRKSAARALFTVGDFLGIDYVDLLGAADPEFAASRRARCCSRGSRSRPPRASPTSSTARTQFPTTTRSRESKPSRATTSPTSCSRPARPAVPRESCSPTRRACAAFESWGAAVRPPRRRPGPDRPALLPLLRLQGGLDALPDELARPRSRWRPSSRERHCVRSSASA